MDSFISAGGESDISLEADYAKKKLFTFDLAHSCMPLLKIFSQDQFLLQAAIKPHFQTSLSRQKRGKKI